MKQKIVSIVKMVTFVKPFNALVKLPWPMKKHLMLVLLATSSIVYGKTYYVATNGKDSNNGTSLSTPFATWQRGINAAYPGDTVYVRGGIYFLAGNNPFVEINPQAWPTPKGRSGTKAKPICFWAYPPDYESGNIPILDCSKAYETYGTNFSCFGLNAVEYWHIKGITVRNAFQRGNANRRPQGFGATLSANLKFENCTAHNISARGFYYESGAWNTWDGPNALWSSDTTYFINCDAYDIRDSVNCSSGDGWKCGNYYGGVLIFDGCRAWDYSDDGFDPGGAGKRIIRNCWAMSGNKYSSLCSGNIEGNGFKTGAIGNDQVGHYPQGYSFVEVTNCIAANCIGFGFYNNLELGRDNNARYFNNTAYRNHGGFFDMPLNTSSRGLETRNNISFYNRSSDYSQVGIYRPSVYVESNNTWKSTQQVNDWPGWIKNPAVTVTDADFISLDASQLKYPRKPDGSLPDITFLKLAAGSDLIDAGIDVGLPYSGSAPDLGYAEYGSVPPTPSVPTFVSASIQNASPDKLEMTYSLSLAAIVPPNSAFIVKVNGQTRTVNAVTVAGNKVTLKLASPVAFGQEVTVAYNKPATNPLQTPQGGQVATMTARNVTNNVAAAIPTFNSAVIQNASPDMLEMTYSLSLAAIVPANSAFIVKVNGQTRTVNAVTVAGNKVTLKLASPVAFGQEVTVAYNKPATNPLQTPQGGQVATMTARNVINNVAETPNQPPLVSISSPTKNTGYIAPATITIEANATDSDGTITKVEFYNGQVKLGEVTKAPYLFKWNSVPEGGYQITAVATDNKNAKTVSSPVTVVVNKPASRINQPPFVRITNPDIGETFKRNESIILKAEALDPDGTISKIEFRIGNEVVAELSEAPWVFNWQNADTGQYVITVIATDNLGAVSQSAEVAFTVYEDKILGLTMLNLYPNPNNGHFTVEMAKEIDSERLYTVFSLSGKVLHNEKRDGHEVITEFNLIELPSGTYILTVSSDNKIIESRKFIKR
jgi:uncharacterized repeat protein (TIGR02059 family)